MKKIKGLVLIFFFILSAVIFFGGCHNSQPADSTVVPSAHSTPSLQATATSNLTLTPSATEVATMTPIETPTHSITPSVTPALSPTASPAATPKPTPDTGISDAAFVRVLEYIPDAKEYLMYATKDNFTGKRIYDFQQTYLRYGTVKKLAAVVEELKGKGLGILIWDGFRPVSAQQALWDICPDTNYVSHPVTGNRSHCRGGAVDLTLFDLTTGKQLVMPSNFDDFSSKADRNYSDVSTEAAANAVLLETVMEKHGFKGYSKEWWHYADEKEYDVDDTFDPSIPVVWEANCDEYINLRRSANTTAKVLAKIYKGSTFTLLEWYGKFAKVEYKNKIGYVMSSFIKPSFTIDPDYQTEAKGAFLDALSIVEQTGAYSYEEMCRDINAICNKYSSIAKTEAIGRSEEKRNIPVIIIGNKNAKHQILIQGGIHAREHLTSWLLMSMAEYWCIYNITDYDDVCFHIIPMSNPDGVVISQTGKLNSSQLKIYQNDKKLKYTSFSQALYTEKWKANALGVDINRNFPAGWGENKDERKAPSSELYGGTAPFSSAEAKALRDYTLKYDFDVTISYHATGSIIYYEYGNKEPVNSLSKSLAQSVKSVSGYILATSYGVDGAGYKDWVMEYLGIPSVTIEIGCQEAALDKRELYSIFVRNYKVMPETIRWIVSNQ
ncbi:MAG: hypothetical protein IKJ75_04160 [Clostridia bacterium]|nr:hypothetical protein [Clostridia bacterium]